MHTEVGGLEILPVIIDGNVFATGGRFVHMDAPLSMGDMEGRVVVCPTHGALRRHHKEAPEEGPSRRYGRCHGEALKDR